MASQHEKASYRHLWTALKIVIGLGLVVLVVRGIEWRELQQSWRAICWLPIGLLIGFRFLVISIRAWRWAVLLGHTNSSPTVGRLTRVLVKAELFNWLLPSTAGGDVYRVLATKSTASTPTATAAVLADRTIGMLALVVSALVVLVVNPGVRQSLIGQVVSGVAAVALGGVALLWLGRSKISSWLSSAAESDNDTRGAVILGHIWRYYQGLEDYSRRPRQLAKALLLSVAPVAGIVVSTYLLCLSVRAVPGVIDLVTVALTVAVIALLPIFVGGLGGQEAAFIFMFQRVGMSSSQAVLIALLSRAAAVIIALIGGLLYVYDSNRAHKQPASTTENC